MAAEYPLVVDKKEFWNLADNFQSQTISHAEELFSYVETADPEDLISVLIQYRFFTIYYIPDLAVLVARLKDGYLRSFMADILSDELGYGKPENAHPRLYDDFLVSLGMSVDALDKKAVRDNVGLLDEIRRDLVDPSKSEAYGIGLRGMGGECVCQVYLSKLHEHFIKNPFVKANKEKIDWRFWDLHIGDHDIEHRIKTRQLIDEEVVQGDSQRLLDLSQGYYKSMNSWKNFWRNILDSVKSKNVKYISVDRDINFHTYSMKVSNDCMAENA